MKDGASDRRIIIDWSYEGKGDFGEFILHLIDVFEFNINYKGKKDKRISQVKWIAEKLKQDDSKRLNKKTLRDMRIFAPQKRLVLTEETFLNYYVKSAHGQHNPRLLREISCKGYLLPSFANLEEQ